jgi:hypothetical protein
LSCRCKEELTALANGWLHSQQEAIASITVFILMRLREEGSTKPLAVLEAGDSSYKLPEYLSILRAGEQGRAYEVCIASRLALTAIAAGDLTINQDSPDSWKAHLESLGFTNVLHSSM